MKTLTEEVIIDNTNVANFLMTFSEFYLAYKFAAGSKKCDLIFLDRSLSNMYSSLMYDTSCRRAWQTNCSILNIKIDNVPIDINDLTMARHNIINDILELPPARGDYLRYAILFNLLKQQHEGESQLDFESICQQLKLGNDEKKRKRAQRYLDKSVEEKLIEEGENGKYHLSERYLSTWTRIKKLVNKVGEQIFQGNKEPFMIQREPGEVRKKDWITTLDLAFLTLFSLYMLIEECWKNNILLIGITKDTIAHDFKNHVIPICITLTMCNLLYTLLLGGAFVKELASSWGILLFIILVATSYAAGQYLLSRFVKLLDSKIGTRSASFSSYFRLMYKGLRIIQYLTAGIFVLMISQLVLTSHYSVGLVFAAMTISFAHATITAVVLSYRFFSWYRSSSNRDIAYTILLFGLTSILIGAWAVLAIIINSGAILLVQLPESGSHLQSKVITPDIVGQDRTAYLLYQLSVIPLRMAYISYWAGTALLLRNYSRGLGKLKFWFLISLPVASYVIAGIGDAIDYKHTNVLFDNMLILAAVTAGAGLYSITFLILARRMKQIHKNPIAYFLIISAYGTMLLIASISSPDQLINPIHGLPYPPFGAVTWSFLAFGIYLYSIGLYFCAIFIAQDTKLRRSIREIAVKESGTAALEQHKWNKK